MRGAHRLQTTAMLPQWTELPQNGIEQPAVPFWSSADVLSIQGASCCIHIHKCGPHCYTVLLQEASKALIPMLGKYYARDDRNVFSAMYSDWVKTRYVAPDTPGSGVFWYRSF